MNTNQAILINWGIERKNIEAAIAGKHYGQKSQIAQAIEVIQDTVTELAADCGLSVKHDLKATFALIAGDFQLDRLVEIVRESIYTLACASIWDAYSTEQALKAVQDCIKAQ